MRSTTRSNRCDGARCAHAAWARAFLEFSPWRVVENADGCPEERPYGVLNEDNADAKEMIAEAYGRLNCESTGKIIMSLGEEEAK